MMTEVPDIILYMKQVKPRYPKLLASIAETCLHPYNLIVEYDENSTAFEACDRAIKRSKSRWTCVCDDDVFFTEKNWLLKLIEVIQTDDALGCLTPHEFKSQEDLDTFYDVGREEYFKSAPYAVTVPWMAGYTTLFDRQKIPHLYCDTNMPGRYGMSDVDLCLQVRDAGWDVGTSTLTTVAHFYHPVDTKYRKKYGIKSENEQTIHKQQDSYMMQKWGNVYLKSKRQHVVRVIKKPE